MQIPTELTKSIIDFLQDLPLVHDKSGRSGLLLGANLDQELLNLISLEEPPNLFFQNLIPVLIKYGKLQDGRDALEALLQSTKYRIGVERKLYCNNLILEWSNYRKLQQATHRETSALRLLEEGTQFSLALEKLDRLTGTPEPDPDTLCEDPLPFWKREPIAFLSLVIASITTFFNLRTNSIEINVNPSKQTYSQEEKTEKPEASGSADKPSSVRQIKEIIQKGYDSLAKGRDPKIVRMEIINDLINTTEREYISNASQASIPEVKVIPTATGFEIIVNDQDLCEDRVVTPTFSIPAVPTPVPTAAPSPIPEVKVIPTATGFEIIVNDQNLCADRVVTPTFSNPIPAVPTAAPSPVSNVIPMYNILEDAPVLPQVPTDECKKGEK